MTSNVVLFATATSSEVSKRSHLSFEHHSDATESLLVNSRIDTAADYTRNVMSLIIIV